MNKYLSLALLASMIQFAPGVADEAVAEDAVNVDGKVYVRPRAVRIMKKGIVVHTKDGAFITPSVSRDENGLFVQEADLEQAPAEMAKRKRRWVHPGQRQGLHLGQRKRSCQGKVTCQGKGNRPNNFKRKKLGWKHKSKVAQGTVQAVEDAAQIAE